MEWIIDLDHQLFHWINSTLANGVFDIFFPMITDLHKTLGFRIIIPVLVFFMFWKGYKKKAFALFVGALVCVGLTDVIGGQVLKKSIDRTRPFDTPGLVVHQKSPASGYSFPSNHALNTFALATYVSFFIPGTSAVLYPIAILVAFSRVYNGVHFPLDVIIGAMLGILIAQFVAMIIWWPLKPRGEFS